jgi:hypothetical protein
MDWKIDTKKREERSYPHKVQLYLNDDENKKLKEDVKRLRLNRSQIIRILLAKKFPYSKLHTDLLLEFRRLNNNINQIARKLNSNELLDDNDVSKLDLILHTYMSIYERVKTLT